jgi:hypothetical protein
MVLLTRLAGRRHNLFLFDTHDWNNQRALSPRLRKLYRTGAPACPRVAFNSKLPTSSACLRQSQTDYCTVALLVEFARFPTNDVESAVILVPFPFRSHPSV